LARNLTGVTPIQKTRSQITVSVLFDRELEVQKDDASEAVTSEDSSALCVSGQSSRQLDWT